MSVKYVARVYSTEEKNEHRKANEEPEGQQTEKLRPIELETKWKGSQYFPKDLTSHTAPSHAPLSCHKDFKIAVQTGELGHKDHLTLSRQSRLIEHK